MAIGSTIFKADIQVSDMDRNYFNRHSLTIARHPSENDERMMVRLLAFMLHAEEGLGFSKGLPTGDEPDIMKKDLTGEIETWIDVGQPDEKKIRKACTRSKQVYVYAYSGRAADVWWEQISSKVGRFSNLTVTRLPQSVSKQLATLSKRTMQLQCTIQDKQVWLSDNENSVHFDLTGN